MRRSMIAFALGGVMISAWGSAAGAQQTIVIENNGVDSSDSAGGADNVNISYDAGNAQTRQAGGANNQTVRAARESKDRGRQDPDAAAAPTDEYVAPVEGEYQDYAVSEEYVEPVDAPQESVAPVDAATTTLRLPNTGSGGESAFSLAGTAAALSALALGALSLRRRQVI